MAAKRAALLEALPPEAVEKSALETPIPEEEQVNFMIFCDAQPNIKLLGDPILQIKDGSCRVNSEAALAVARRHLTATPGLRLVNVDLLEQGVAEQLERTGNAVIPQAMQGAFTTDGMEDPAMRQLNSMIADGSANIDPSDLSGQMAPVENVDDPTKTAVRVEEGLNTAGPNNPLAGLGKAQLPAGGKTPGDFAPPSKD